MKILFLTPSVRLLGARQSLLALVKRLPPGTDPLVICPGESGLAEELRRSSISVEIIPHGAWRKVGGRLRASFLQIPAIKRVVSRFHPAVIHCNEFHSTPQGVKASAALPGVAVTSHVRLSITPRQIRNYLLPSCDRIAAVSNACRELFADSGLIDRVEVIYNGADTAEFERADRAQGMQLREQLGWGADDIVFSLLGLVSPRKNQLIAAEAIAEANRRGVPARLLIAGDAFKSTEEYGAKVRERIEQDDLRGRVAWLPFQNNVPPIYACADINLLISGEEGFGRTIIESGAMGIPSIGARTGGIPELILEEKTGWLVDAGSVASLARLMEQIHRQRENIPSIGAQARTHIKANFTIESHVEKMMKFWQKAIETTGTRSHGGCTEKI